MLDFLIIKFTAKEAPLRWITVLSALFASLTFSWPAWGGEAESFFERGNFRLLGNSSHYLQLGAGVFDVGDDYSAAAGLAEVRFGRKLAFIGPILGVMANVDGGVLGYAGIYGDMLWGKLAITPAWAVGAYRQGNSRDLGGTFELRTALTLAWAFDNGVRLGVHGAHISNGKLHEKNPGEDELMLVLALPF